MTIKKMIYNTLMGLGLAGAIGGFGSAIYTIPTQGSIPRRSPALQRMHEIEQGLENITGKAIFEDPQLKDRYTALVGELNTFKSNPLAMQEKEEYQKHVDIYLQNANRFDGSLTLGVFSFLPLFAGYNLKKIENEKSRKKIKIKTN